MMKAQMITVIGERECQQDRCGYQLNDSEALFIVCDGMGGLANGALAAQTALDAMLSIYEKNGYIADPHESLCSMTIEANKAVRALAGSKKELPYAGTTMTAVFIRDGKLYWNNVGDSRAYLYRNGSFAQITQDHVYRAILDEQLRKGMIGKSYYEEQLSNQDALISYLGIWGDPLIDHEAVPFELCSKDIILLTTDGLYRILNDRQLKDIIMKASTLKDALERMDSEAQRIAQEQNLSRDNMTCILVQIG